MACQAVVSHLCTEVLPNPSRCLHNAAPGEVGGDVFILVRGQLHVLDLDHETFLFKIPEGTVFGESTVLRHIEVGVQYAAWPLA